MAERPILFSGPMVRAILEGRKTQTRRVVKLPHANPLGVWEPTTYGGTDAKGVEHDDQVAIWHTRTGETFGCPYGNPGERLWVKETFMVEAHPGDIGLKREDIPRTWDAAVASAGSVYYRADPGSEILADGRAWKSPRYMPRKLSRLLLEITDVRVERLQSISEADCRAEGCNGGHDSIPGHPYSATPKEHFWKLWESINGRASWGANPFVWVVEFKRVEKVDG